MVKQARKRGSKGENLMKVLRRVVSAGGEPVVEIRPPCPYTVGKRVCVAGPAGHSGAHDWTTRP